MRDQELAQLVSKRADDANHAALCKGDTDSAYRAECWTLASAILEGQYRISAKGGVPVLEHAERPLPAWEPEATSLAWRNIYSDDPPSGERGEHWARLTRQEWEDLLEWVPVKHRWEVIQPWDLRGEAAGNAGAIRWREAYG